MTVLGIDAARGVFSCAAVREGTVLAAHAIPGKSALEGGLAAVAGTLEAAGLPQSGVSLLAVGIGPGTFTGVRIAVSYAKSLALAWNVPLSGIDTFDALETAAEERRYPLLAAVRGRTGVVSVRYRAGADAPFWRDSGYVHDVLERLAERRDRSNELYVLGDAQDVLPGLAERGWTVHHIEAAVEPPAAAVAFAAASREPAASPHAVRPDYGELAPVSKPPGRHGA